MHTNSLNILVFKYECFPSKFLGAVPDFTCFNLRPVATDGENTFIGGYKSGNDTRAAVSFNRLLDTGSGVNLPARGEVNKHISAYALLFQMPALIGAERFGVYNCIFTRQQDTVRITTTVMRKDGKSQELSILLFFYIFYIFFLKNWCLLTTVVASDSCCQCKHFV